MKTATILYSFTLAGFGLLALGSSKSPDSDKPGDKPTETTSATTSAAKVDLTGAPKAICDDSAGGSAGGGTCNEIFNFGILGEAQQKDVCARLGNKYTSGASCPRTATVIGSCAHEEDGTKLTYYRGTEDDVAGAAVKDGCDATHGKWTDGPSAAPPKAKAAPAKTKK